MSQILDSLGHSARAVHFALFRYITDIAFTISVQAAQRAPHQSSYVRAPGIWSVLYEPLGPNSGQGVFPLFALIGCSSLQTFKRPPATIIG